MDKKQCLDKADRVIKKRILANAISDCMVNNSMTIENLDEACEIIKEIYRKNATVKKAD